MKFCPNCEVKLKKSDSGLQCSKCGYTEGKQQKQTKKIIEDEEPNREFNVFEGNVIIVVSLCPTLFVEGISQVTID